ncbi:MAG: hypothetical protein ACHQ4H_14360 [Ktedonobacterales bacterium]
MQVTNRLLVAADFLGVAVAVDLGVLLAGYGLLRLLRISISWTTWAIGGTIIVASAWLCLATFSQRLPAPGDSNLLGFLSLAVTLLAAYELPTRRWYLRVKRGPMRAFAHWSRGVLGYLTRHHSFFGWVAIAAAVAHSAFYWPLLVGTASRQFISGIAALMLLALLTGAGIWIERAIRTRGLAHSARLLHIVFSAAFVAAVLVHIGL